MTKHLGVHTHSFLQQFLLCRYKDGYEVLTAPSNPKSHRVILPTGSLFFLRVMQNKKEEVSWKMRRKRCVYVFYVCFYVIEKEDVS